LGHLLLLLLAPATAAAKDVDVQLLGLNDFHGHLESSTPGTIAPDPSSPRVPAGGAEYLATDVRAKEKENRNTLVVSAGDLIGASPLLSALFHDEPTIEAMNKIGLDLSSVGNHEFDEGAAELKRMQNGAATPSTAARTALASGARSSVTCLPTSCAPRRARRSSSRTRSASSMESRRASSG
jgi:5'-nucleotidase